MSFRFGNRSLQQLDTVDPKLKALAIRALELSPHDFTIIQGKRTVEQSAQNIANVQEPNFSLALNKYLQAASVDFSK